MSRIRRNRLVSLGMGSQQRGNRPRMRERCHDDGAPIQTRGGIRMHRPYPQWPGPTHPAALGIPIRHAEEDDWGWPAAEQSSLRWPEEDGDAASAMSLAAAIQQPVTPSVKPAPTMPSAPPVPPKTLAEDELDDDLAELRPARDAVIDAPASGVAFPTERTSQPSHPAPPTADVPEPAEDRHAIFGQLARTMPHATSFQLGRFDVDHHLDMLEQGLAAPAAAAMAAQAPPPGSRELHDLDVLSEITALSEAAGVRPIEAEEDGAFLRKVARAQSSLAELDAAARHSADAANAVRIGDDEPESAKDEDDEDHSPFPEADDAEEAESAENDDG